MKNKDKILAKYGFPKREAEVVAPVIEALCQKDVPKAERELAMLSLKVCDEIERGDLTPKEGDDYFLLIDLCIDENFPDLKFMTETDELRFEGMILHDYGKDFGASLETMRKLSEKILDNIEKLEI